MLVKQVTQIVDQPALTLSEALNDSNFSRCIIAVCRSPWSCKLRKCSKACKHLVNRQQGSTGCLCMLACQIQVGFEEINTLDFSIHAWLSRRCINKGACHDHHDMAAAERIHSFWQQDLSVLAEWHQLMRKNITHRTMFLFVCLRDKKKVSRPWWYSILLISGHDNQQESRAHALNVII